MCIFKGSRCANQIEEVCKEIEKTINQTIQNTLNSLERDCDQIYQLVEDKLREDRYIEAIFGIWVSVNVCVVR